MTTDDLPRPDSRGGAHATRAVTVVMWTALRAGLIALLLSPFLVVICGAPDRESDAVCAPLPLAYVALGLVPAAAIAVVPAMVGRAVGRGHVGAVVTWVLAAAAFTGWAVLFVQLG